jgi:hypothetical protein
MDFIATYKEFAQELANGVPLPEAFAEIPEVRDALTRRARFMKNSKVRQAIMLKKIMKKFEDHLRSGARKAQGCTRFGPRKESSTARKEKNAIEQIEKTLHAWGYHEVEIKELFFKVQHRVGGR